jgi:hypothetical protein
MDSGRVLKGTWNKTPVALKVLKTDHGIAPNSMVISEFSSLGIQSQLLAFMQIIRREIEVGCCTTKKPYVSQHEC